MTDFKLESTSFRPFDLARQSGMRALEHLSEAHDKCKRWEALRDEMQDVSNEKLYKKYVGEISEKRSLEQSIAQNLFVATIMFQASMESILTMTADLDDRVEDAINPKDSFADKWKKALKSVGEDTSEFTRYKSLIYDKYRNPLAHLGSDDDVQKINNITFKEVYCGIRCGWWAYDMLLHGIRKTPGDHEKSWRTICSGAKLKHDLYQDDDLLS